jgi:signal peptidase I
MAHVPSSGRPGQDEPVALEDRPPGGGAPGGPPPVEPPEEEARRSRPSARRRVIEWLAIVAIAVVVALVMRIYVVQTFYIPSISMTPTLQVGDRILVDKLAYHLHGVGRGDIIVFNAPPDVATDCDTTDKVLVKRVIGLPGETISDRGYVVYINGKPLDQSWLPKNDPDTRTPPFKAVHIPANDYFVMGDDRAVSCDSRIWGFVKRSEIIGKVDMRIWPLSRLTFF